MRVTLIYNPVSGRGSGRAAADRAVKFLESRDHAVTTVETRADTSARASAVEAIAAGAERIVALGGDGTVLEAAEGILSAGASVPLAIVARGTANVLATNLELPTRLDPAVRVAEGGVPIRIDVGLLDGAPFLLAAGSGVHADLIEGATRDLKRRWGVGAYGWAGLKAALRAKPTRYAIVLDGRAEEVEATMLQVMNCGAILRRRWEFAPGISPVDGRLDVLAFRARSIAEYLETAARVVAGVAPGDGLIARWSAARVEVDADPPTRFQIDGELAGPTPSVVEVSARALPVIVPSGSRWAA